VTKLEEVQAQHGTQLQGHESRLALLESKITAAVSKGPAALAKFLGDWWDKVVGRLKKAVKDTEWVARVIDWFNTNGCVGACINVTSPPLISP
jgi:hypothetical protein